jgi:hypothetical protein
MKYLQDNWLALLTAWATANAILSPLSAKVSATSWYGKALHVFVAVSPLDILKAWKALGAQMTVPLACLLLLLGCASVTPLEQYRTEQLACVDKYSTVVDIDLCRNSVKARHCGAGGDLADAGGCSWDGAVQ